MTPEWWMDPRARFFPLILTDGRWNISDPDRWLKDGTVEPGLASGRAPLVFGDAVYADHLAYRDMLRTLAAVSEGWRVS